MTITAAAVEQKRINWKWTAIIAVLIAVTTGSWAYAAKYTECDIHSKFCVANIPGTRSEVGCEWDTWSCYVSTYPANEPAEPVKGRLV